MLSVLSRFTMTLLIIIVGIQFLKLLKTTFYCRLYGLKTWPFSWLLAILLTFNPACSLPQGPLYIAGIADVTIYPFKPYKSKLFSQPIKLNSLIMLI